MKNFLQYSKTKIFRNINSELSNFLMGVFRKVPRIQMTAKKSEKNPQRGQWAFSAFSRFFFSVYFFCGFHNISRMTGRTSKLLEINSSVTVKFSSRLAIHSGDTVKNTWKKKALKTPSGKAPAALVSSSGLSAKHAGDLPEKVWTALD